MQPRLHASFRGRRGRSPVRFRVPGKLRFVSKYNFSLSQPFPGFRDPCGVGFVIGPDAEAANQAMFRFSQVGPAITVRFGPRRRGRQAAVSGQQVVFEPVKESAQKHCQYLLQE